MTRLTDFDLLVKGGTLVDAAHERLGRFDVGLAGGRVAAVEVALSPGRARRVYDAAGKLVLPGLVDSHVHLAPGARAAGFQMLARAGVTCALECGGLVEDVLEGMARQGSGISVAVLNRLDPGVTLSGADASRAEVEQFLDGSLQAGALGLKLLGGHLPLSPETTTAAIAAANAAGAYVAFHCGSTRNGSNLLGLLDALEFAGENRLHLCHVNSYCRGLTHGSPVAESMMALEALGARPHQVSESHMAAYNSTGARLEGDAPRSHVTRTWLQVGGFAPSRAGLLAAARGGYLRVQQCAAGDCRYLEPEAGAAYLEAVDFQAMVSFAVNPRSTAFLMATEKGEDGRFLVTALSTDGGGIPRNFLLSHGLSLVEFEALTLSEFVQKCAWDPARMLGLPQKGHLGPGADGDLVVADPGTRQALLTVVGGQVIMEGGVVKGSGGTLITTERGAKALADRGVPCQVADLPDSLFYTAPA